MAQLTGPIGPDLPRGARSDGRLSDRKVLRLRHQSGSPAAWACRTSTPVTGRHDPAAQALLVRYPRPGVLELQGELDVNGTAVLADALMVAVADGAERLVVELSELRFLDAAGASTLCRPAVERAVALRLRNPQPVVREVLTVLGYEQVPTIALCCGEGR